MMKPKWVYTIVSKSGIFLPKWYHATEINRLSKKEGFWDKIKGVHFVCISPEGNILNEYFASEPFTLVVRNYIQFGINVPQSRYKEFILKRGKSEIYLKIDGKIEVKNGNS